MTLPPLEPSPDMLPGKSVNAASIRRLNRVPLLIVLMLGAMVMGAIGYTYYVRVQTQHHQDAESETMHPQAAAASALFKDAPQTGPIMPDPLPVPSQPLAAPVSTDNRIGQANPPPNDNAEWQAWRQQELQIEQAREQAALSALTSTPEAGGKIGSNPAGPVTAPLGIPAALPQPAILAANAPGDLNGQSAKHGFLGTIPLQGSNDTLASGRRASLTPYDIKAGTVIPATMVGGIDSDLPGQIIGQVAENVYDTATGQYVLIPQGSKLVGSYDSSVTTGQDRVLVAWHRIIFPDASSLDLGSMPGADQGGYAGFSDQVDSHYLASFGNALLLSAFSAGIQLSQPQAANGQNYSSQQIIAGTLGQQLGELGTEIARRNLQIQPTLTIRPGYQFNVMVTKDIVLTPWTGSEP
jgi:type IV secretion system protein VirB10